MFPDIFISTILLTFVNFVNPATGVVSPVYENVLATKEMSLQMRYGDRFVNNVFSDNILLNLNYLSGKVKSASSINWDEVRKPFRYEMRLGVGEMFAFHDDILPGFRDKVVKTTNAHFNYTDGFKSSGYLFGDGVCHLASLINWAAKSAKLEVQNPTSHNFAVIPQIPQEFGVSIYNHPDNQRTGELQNLYIKNSLKNPVVFVFEFDGDVLKVIVVEITSN